MKKTPGQRLRAPGVLALIWLMGCAGPTEDPWVRDVRPTSLGVGDKLLAEGRSGAFVVGAPTKVKLIHLLPHGQGEQTLLELEGRAVSDERVLADIDEVAEAQLGQKHTDFQGILRVEQSPPGGAPTVRESSARYAVHLDLLPHTMRQMASSLVKARNQQELLEWLGMSLRATPQGLQVSRVRHAFEWAPFMNHYDRPPLDSKVDKGEFEQAEAEDAKNGAALGTTAGKVSPAEFHFIDKDKNGVVSRDEAEAYEHPASFAAQAGLRDGDVVTSAAGQPVKSVEAFAAAWQKDIANVDASIARPGAAAFTASLPRHGAPAGIPEGFLLAGIMIAFGLLILLPVGPLSGLIIVLERKVSARMQSRVGPNRVGPQGWLQWLADGIKLIIKEDIVPTEADPILFKIAPFVAFAGLFLTFVVLPMSQTLVIADLNIGLLYLLSVTSLVVVSIIMGGWASNSKWSLLGGMRSAAQIISYELPASVALLSVVTLTGSLSLQTIVRTQGGAPWHWNLFANPMTFACFFIYFISALAEGNRTPFDLPEAESELVSGYNTEYSGFRFSIFPMVEYANLFVISAVATTLFLGGWGLPGISPEKIEASGLFTRGSLLVVLDGVVIFGGSIFAGYLLRRPALASLGTVAALPVMLIGGYVAHAYQLASALMFLGKVTTLVFVIIWIRWTLPRFRVDQMMNMCWKFFIPISFACFLATTGWVWLTEPERMHLLKQGMQWAMFLVFGVGLLVLFCAKVIHNLRTTRLLGVDRQLDFNLFQ